MADDKELRQENTAFTAPAEEGSYQFCSQLNSTPPESKHHSGKSRNSIGFVIAGILVLIAASTAFCVLVLQLTLSVRQDENGFSIALVRKKDTQPILRLEEPGASRVQAGATDAQDGQERYEWAGETLLMTSDGKSNPNLLPVR